MRHPAIRLARWLTPLLLLTGCTAATSTAGTPPAEPTPPFGDCAALAAAPASATGTAAAAAVVSGLPDVMLPCFTGGQPVRLADLQGPAVINLWGSYCGPCRAELPAVQRLADRTAGRLHVIAVNTRDDRPAAISFGVDKRISLPTLYDRNALLMGALGKLSLPLTVFVDGAGTRFVYNGSGLDDAALAELVDAHTGVTVVR